MKIFTTNILSNKGFTSNVSGLGNSKAVALVNEAGQFGFLGDDETPYTPCGGRKALVQVYESAPEIFTFKDFSFGEGFSSKRGRAV